jgi:hypothetical protein
LKRVRIEYGRLPTVWMLVLLLVIWSHDAHADKKTICTITVNSSDEKEEFRRNLPPDRFQFVELVERGRPDWLASACQQRIRCDVLVISGHYDGRDEFYSDRVGLDEFLPVEEMERASCSHSCSDLFSHLKEVYLFGCNTLNPEALKHTSGEIERSLRQSGYSPAGAERLFRALSVRHGESSRDRMRLIFKDVPVLYGFSAKAPLGPVAASMLNGYFASGGGSEIGGGHASPKLLGHFASTSLTVASGLSVPDALAGLRQDVCQFSDDGLLPVQKVGFVHQLMDRDMAEVRLFLDRIEKYVASVSEIERQVPEVAQEVEAITRDRDARARYLKFARDTDQPAVRVRMIKLASRLGWLSQEEERDEFVRMISDRLASGTVSSADVDLVCVLNQDRELDQELGRFPMPTARTGTVAQAAILACLGSTVARDAVLLAVTSPDAQEAEIAQVFLHDRPIADAMELRGVATAIVGMSSSAAQVRALDALAHYQLSDRIVLTALAHLFSFAKSANVQRAIAGVLIRSDYRTIAGPELVRVLREHRLKSQDGVDLIDVLIRRVEASYLPRS